MSELELLFLVLAALYGWECGCWVRRGSVAFRTWLGGRWRVCQPSMLFGNQRGGLSWAAPLPPLGTFLTANQFPVSLSAEGALAFVSTNVNPGWRPAQTGRLVRFVDLKEIAVRGRKILINGELFALGSSALHATWLAGQLRRLTKMPAAQREQAITEMLRDSLDAAAVEKRRREFAVLARPVRLLANAVLLYLFVLAPVLLWLLGLKLSWLGLLIGLLALTTTCAVFFHRAHRKLYPEAEDERFSHFIMIWLAPAVTTRAHDVLSRPLLESFHPLTVAKVLCPVSEFKALAQAALRDLRHPALPLCSDGDSAAAKVEASARARLQKAVEGLLKQTGLNPDEFDRPPAPADDSCRSYCPRCGAQFTHDTGTCADCGGLALVAFSR